MAGKTYNVGVIGYGMSAKVFHIPLVLITPQFTLHSIVQRTPKPNDDASKDHPSTKIYHSAPEMFADPSIDIIVITTTPDTHFSFTKSALEAGKHAIVEKPFVPTSGEAQQLVDISAKTGKLICVYQNRRWDTDFLTVKKLLDEGTIGRCVEFETHFDRYKAIRPETWKGTLGMDQAGGVIYDLGTHLIDQAYVLFGMPASVTGVFANQRNDGQAEPDSFTVMLQYSNGGPLVTAKAGVMCVETEQLRYWVRGSKGSFKKFHLDVQEDQLKAGLKPGDQGFGIESDDRAGSLVVLDGETKPKGSTLKNVTPLTYASLYAGFAKAIEGGGESAVPVKASEARDVLRIIEAAKESAKSGRSVAL
ncbi:NAD(P)-binding Rossmann-fold containing protein [Venustampulla echinocandica]|uniref:NAD(P)-binding Rossmann-fold containing protein n=1 Tax=Venustampulla echinocandica TaxID=2656787 RepID=A0A370TV43_9HELO|nr:NAD(P)-binding Rossmann-fold containing protein [Venustampulla echinocandica]RDL39369.1 NAD(P)-binding Rossmann-fold containing protein [Venustampulla echinocandica]